MKTMLAEAAGNGQVGKEDKKKKPAIESINLLGTPLPFSDVADIVNAAGANLKALRIDLIRRGEAGDLAQLLRACHCLETLSIQVGSRGGGVRDVVSSKSLIFVGFTLTPTAMESLVDSLLSNANTPALETLAIEASAGFFQQYQSGPLLAAVCKLFKNLGSTTTMSLFLTGYDTLLTDDSANDRQSPSQAFISLSNSALLQSTPFHWRKLVSRHPRSPCARDYSGKELILSFKESNILKESWEPYTWSLERMKNVRSLSIDDLSYGVWSDRSNRIGKFRGLAQALHQNTSLESLEWDCVLWEMRTQRRPR